VLVILGPAEEGSQADAMAGEDAVVLRHLGLGQLAPLLAHCDLCQVNEIRQALWVRRGGMSIGYPFCEMGLSTRRGELKVWCYQESNAKGAQNDWQDSPHPNPAAPCYLFFH